MESDDLYRRRLGGFQDQGIVRLSYFENTKGFCSHCAIIAFGILQTFSRCTNSLNALMKETHAATLERYCLSRPFVMHFSGLEHQRRVREITEWVSRA